ncbi:MAG: hypothetical protein WA653_02205 [Candidatus Sulfotelmatobacter sp.]
MAAHGEDAIFQVSCAMPNVGNAFSFKREDARAFELPLVLFERPGCNTKDVTGFLKSPQPGGSKGYVRRLQFMRPFAPSFAKMVI